MRDMFRGWRRKTGVTLLIVACAVCMIWMRSGAQMDMIFVSFVSMKFELTTHVNGLVLNVSSAPDKPFYFYSANWITVLHPTSYKLRGVSIPYWCLVLPPTLLSAWLLFAGNKNTSSEDRPTDDLR